MPKVLRTSEANPDLVEIAYRIAEENPIAADDWLDAIGQKCQLLAQMPELGRKRPDLAPEVRSFPVGNYVIFCRPVNRGIQVIRILHGARNIPMLFD